MKVGFIGLGIMGKPMCRNLIRAGYELTVYNRTQSKADELVGMGAKRARTPAEAAQGNEVVITVVTDSPQVREVCLGENGVAFGAAPGTVLIDMSSIDPTQSRAIGAELSAYGIRMLDAPVSGGEPKAIDGTLSVMAGGEREIFDRYEELLHAMGSSVVYCGDLGSGNVAKLANQIIVAVNIGAVAEALTFAKKAGADPHVVYEAIKGGLAGSAVLDAKAPMMMDGNFTPGFRIDLHVKDLTNAICAAHAVSSPVPLAGQLMEMMQALKADGCGKEDHSSLIKFYEKIADVTLE